MYIKKSTPVQNKDEVKSLNRKCYIVGGGENFGLTFKKEPGDYVIAADAGYRHLEEAQ